MKKGIYDVGAGFKPAPAIIAGLLFVILFSGCGQNKESPRVVTEVPVEVPAVLPELPQNSYQAQGPVIEPDYSFQPIPDEQQPVLPEVEAKKGPPVD